MNIWERIHNILTDWGILPRPSVQYTSIGWRIDPWNATDGMTETFDGETAGGEFTGERDVRVTKR